MSTVTRHPEVLWAQRSDRILITINLTDVKDDNLNVESDSLTFKGISNQQEYKLDLKFYAKIKKDTARIAKTARGIHLVLEKEEQNKPYWPRLQEEKIRMPFIKTDFSRWKDEDEEDDDGDSQFNADDDMDMDSDESSSSGEEEPVEAEKKESTEEKNESTEKKD
jgi:prostaglandin-E synthase